MGRANDSLRSAVISSKSGRSAVLFLVAFAAGSACFAESPLAPQMQAVEQIRGRKFVSTVKNVSIDRAALQPMLREQMAKELPYSLEEWVAALRALQLVVDVEAKDVLPKLLSLYEAQVLAFYDPHSHTYYSINQMPPALGDLGDPKMMAEMVAVHELMHAMQDQHFRIGERTKTLRNDTDAGMAYHALLEGEALLVMIAHTLKQAGVELDQVVKNDAMVNALLTAAANDRITKQAAYESVMRTSAESLAMSDPLVHELNTDLTRLEREYNEKLAQFKPGHPTMIQLSEQIDKARGARQRAMQQAVSKARETARSDLSAAQQRESSVRAMYDAQKRETQQLNVNATTYLDLRTTVETKQTLLATLQKQLSETEVTARLRGSATSNVHWVDHAQLPGGRFNATMKRNLQNAMPLGLMLGLATIFFLEYMDRSIKTPEELEKVTKFASLGVIPSASSMSRNSGVYSYGRGTAKLRAVQPSPDEPQGVELIPHTDSRSPVAEAYRAFRTSLLLASAKSPKVIVITSSFAREGKTTTSINLATVLAQMGRPVLLVDADLRRPRIQKVFRGKMNLGLVNYLAANIPIEDVIQETEVPNLSVMLSGPIPPNPSELLASDRMKQMIENVRGKFAYVIFDSPPVLAVTDAIVLAASADGVVLTIHGGQTPREHVQRSAERLRHSNIPVLGALLNNLDLSQYGYTYRKSYYDYYESDDAGEEPKKARKTS